MSEAVRMALEAACREDAFYGPGKSLPGYDAELRAEYAQIIAAFLRALPSFVDVPDSDPELAAEGFTSSLDLMSAQALADAVEAAAKEGE